MFSMLHSFGVFLGLVSDESEGASPRIGQLNTILLIVILLVLLPVASATKSENNNPIHILH